MLDKLAHTKFDGAWVRIHDSGDFLSRRYPRHGSTSESGVAARSGGGAGAICTAEQTGRGDPSGSRTRCGGFASRRTAVVTRAKPSVS